MHGAEDLVQAQVVLHRQHVFCDQLARVGADDGDAEDAVTPRYGQHLDETFCCFIGNRSVQIINAVAGDLVINALRLGFGFRQPHAGDLWVGKGAVRQHPVIGLEAAKGPEQRVHGGVPGLMGCCVGELVRAGYIANGEDVGEAGGEVFVGFQRAVVAQREIESFDTVAAGIGDPAEGDQNAVKFDVDGAVVIERATPNGRNAITQFEGLGLMAQPQVDTGAAQAAHHQFAGVGVFAGQQACTAFDLNHL